MTPMSTRALLLLFFFSFCVASFARAIPAPSSLRVKVLDAPGQDIYHAHSPTPKDETISSTSLSTRNSHLVQLEERTQQLSWGDAVRKGQTLWNNLRNYLASSNPPEGIKYPGRRLKLYITVRQNANVAPPKSIASDLRSEGVNTGPSWLYLSIKQDDRGSSNYKNYYYYDATARAGIILSDHQSRGPNAKLPWSEVAYQQYKAFPGADLTRLRYIYRVTISTPSTIELMRRAVMSGQYSDVESCGDQTWYSFTPGNTPSESFLALLGSKNGRGVGHMLVDHTKALGKKSIEAIKINLALNSMKFVLTI